MTVPEPFPLAEPSVLATRPTSRTKDRSNAEFREFYDDSADGVFRALALALGDVELAQEATNEAMVRAFQRWRRVRRFDSPAGWAYRVGLNWARGQLRKTKREWLTAKPLAAQVNSAISDSSVKLGVDTDLRRALAALSIDARSVVVLRYLLGWSTAETSAALGVAEGTVKSRLSRALSELEGILKERHD